VDFGCTIVCVEVLGLWYGHAGIVGNVVGAVTNFVIGRQWVFLSSETTNLKRQALRYAIVWFGYVALGFLLLVAVTDYVDINYRIAKLLVAIFLSVTYNYVLQKRYVFK
jgi:putative flippase GtrA